MSSDLNLVQTRTGNPGLTEYLEGLVGRAYAQMVVPREAKFFRSWWMILRHYFPAALRLGAGGAGARVATLIGGLLLGLIATYAKPAVAPVFLPAEHLQETPRNVSPASNRQNAKAIAPSPRPATTARSRCSCSTTTSGLRCWRWLSP